MHPANCNCLIHKSNFSSPIRGGGAAFGGYGGVYLRDGGHLHFNNKSTNFDYNLAKHEISNIISGISKVKHGDFIQTTTGYLAAATQAGGLAKEQKQFKEQEAAILNQYAAKNNLWVTDIDFNNLQVNEGAEQQVYFLNEYYVVKTNDAIFYESWHDYFVSLLLHNYFFPGTAYELIGFTIKNNKLHSVVKQKTVIPTEATDLNQVKQFLHQNGFEVKRNNDYEFPELGIILEDLHDENVLTKNGILFFIDTVFYMKNAQQFTTGGLIAPNGNQTNLTPQQYKLVRTPEFKAWFGDWENSPATASKVVDENGEPLVVYHATSVKEKFYVFKTVSDKQNGPIEVGAHFGSLTQANRIVERRIHAQLPYNIYECFLSIKNPLRVDDITRWYPESIKKYIFKNKTISSQLSTITTHQEMLEELNKKNIDGFIYSNIHEGEGLSYSVFNPSQIKLADGTNTTFNGNNPDIRFADGGKVKKVIKRNLPINVTYKLIDSYYTGGITDNPDFCENCGRPIANVAIIEDENHKTYHVGMDCAETLASIKNSLEFAAADNDFKEATGIRTKIKNTLKKKPTAVINVTNTPSGKISIEIRDTVGAYLGSFYLDKNFVFKYLPDYAQKIKNPDKNSFTANWNAETTPELKNFNYHPFKFKDQYAGPATLQVGPYTINVLRKDKTHTTESGKEITNNYIIIEAFKNSTLIGSDDFYTANDIPRKIAAALNKYEFDNLGKFAEGGDINSNKAFGAASRFKPSERIAFDPPITGPSGAKLVDYVWAYEWTMLPNYEGELISKRQSDWDQAIASADTGKNIVHQFTVLLPDGKTETVSAESVLVLLGYTTRTQTKSFPSLVNAAKTLAKQKMQLAIMEEQEKAYNQLLAQLEKAEKPPVIEIEEPVEFVRKHSDLYNDTVFAMGDAWYRQSNEYVYETKTYKKSLYPTKHTIEQLTSSWISNRLKEAGLSYPRGIYDLRKRVTRQERKIKELSQQASQESQQFADGGDINPEIDNFDWEALFNDAGTNDVAPELSRKDELRKNYLNSRFSKKWAATLDEAIEKTVAEYNSAKNTFNEWAGKQYKQNKGNVWVGEELGGKSYNIGRINEKRRNRNIEVAKSVMDDAIKDLKEFGLNQQEIDELLQGEKFATGGHITFNRLPKQEILGKKYKVVFRNERSTPVRYRAALKHHEATLKRLQENNYSDKRFRTADERKANWMKAHINKFKYMASIYLDNTGTIIDVKEEFKDGGPINFKLDLVNKLRNSTTADLFFKKILLNTGGMSMVEITDYGYLIDNYLLTTRAIYPLDATIKRSHTRTDHNLFKKQISDSLTEKLTRASKLEESTKKAVSFFDSLPKINAKDVKKGDKITIYQIKNNEVIGKIKAIAKTEDDNYIDADVVNIEGKLTDYEDLHPGDFIPEIIRTTAYGEINTFKKGGPIDAKKEASEFIKNLPPGEFDALVEKFASLIKERIIAEQVKLDDLLEQKSKLNAEALLLDKRDKETQDYQLKQTISDQKRNLRNTLKELETLILSQTNVVDCLRNGGTLISFTDKKGTEHNNIPDYRRIEAEFIAFNEETILTDPLPPYIPQINQETFRSKGYVFDVIRIENDGYLLAVNGFKEKAVKKEGYSYIETGEHPTDAQQGYVIVTLDQLALISEYYFAKAKAQNQKDADDADKRSEESYLKLPLSSREYYLKNVTWDSLPAKTKKQITKQQWDGFTIPEKEQYYKPIKRHAVKRLTSKLEDRQMWISFHDMYNRFVEPTHLPHKGKDALSLVPEYYDKESAELTAKKQPNTVFGHPAVFAYWYMFRDFLDWKIKDIKVQRETTSEIRLLAIETSFGESNTNNSLKPELGILVKRQDGSQIKPTEIEQIKTGWELVLKTFGNLSELAAANNLKISHTGTKYVFSSKAAGMYVPDKQTIAVSNKFGTDQFNSIMAHEVAHWIDHQLGKAQNKRHATDDFESTAGTIARVFRKNMNTKSDSDYTNATAECFARAFEQYFAIETQGENAQLIYNGKPLDSVVTYITEGNYVSKAAYYNQIKPLIQKFLTEHANFLKFGS